MDGLVLALLDNSAAITAVGDAALAARLRDLTISWSRFKYSGLLLEGADLDALLGQAAGSGYRYCLVQSWGHVLQEVWTPESGGATDFVAVLERWVAAAGDFLAARPLRNGFDPRSLRLDLEQYRRLGRPAFGAAGGNLARHAAAAGPPIVAFPEPLAAATAWLTPGSPAAALGLRRWLSPGATQLGSGDSSASDFEMDEATALLGEPAARFLSSVAVLAGNLPRGVFVWNLEPYDDVDQPPPDLASPLDSVYSVAAGLKSNRMLETHGFDPRTRVVFFDYSASGLEFRRRLLADWDGADYPDFLRRLFRRLPASEAFYCLWDGATPAELDWQDVETRWQQEIERWGGAGVLRAHWRRYRRLPHRFVRCDLLGDCGALLAELRDEPSAAIWWSNAFSSIYSNWHHSAGQRRRIYGRWIAELAARAPRLLLYGASSDHVSVNSVRAAGYLAWFGEHAGDELAPGRCHRVEIRF